MNKETRDSCAVGDKSDMRADCKMMFARIESKLDRICGALWGNGDKDGVLTRIKLVEIGSATTSARAWDFVRLLIAAALAVAGSRLVG